METYKKELDSLRTTIENFYTTKFTSSEKEYERNKTIKEQIGQFLVRVKKDLDLSGPEQQHLVNEALMLLAANTGCAEDSEIAEQILDQLFFDLKVINKTDIDRYYQFNASQRWE